jgi:hypothetical protein
MRLSEAYEFVTTIWRHADPVLQPYVKTAPPGCSVYRPAARLTAMMYAGLRRWAMTPRTC